MQIVFYEICDWTTINNHDLKIAVICMYLLTYKSHFTTLRAKPAKRGTFIKENGIFAHKIRIYRIYRFYWREKHRKLHLLVHVCHVLRTDVHCTIPKKRTKIIEEDPRGLKLGSAQLWRSCDVYTFPRVPRARWPIRALEYLVQPAGDAADSREGRRAFAGVSAFLGREQSSWIFLDYLCLMDEIFKNIFQFWRKKSNIFKSFVKIEAWISVQKSKQNKIQLAVTH